MSSNNELSSSGISPNLLIISALIGMKNKKAPQRRVASIGMAQISESIT